MNKKIIVPFGVATLAMAMALSVAASDGATVARSYSVYNGQAASTDSKYREVSISWKNNYKEVTAEEACNIKDGILIFAFPTCPYCRNLIPELTSVAAEENQMIYYCKIDDYRDKYIYNQNTANPEMIKAAGEGYGKLLDWLGNYLVDYVVYDQDSNPVEVGEKRIGAPNIIRIKDGEPVSSWKLSDVEGVTFPENKYDTWDEDTQKAVTTALKEYIEEG